MSNTILITRYIAAWSWHIIAMIFLLGFIIALMLSQIFWAIGLVGVLIVCEFFAWTRQKEIVELENEYKEE